MKEFLTNIGYDLILEKIPANAKVLDLGCGGGDLLSTLQDKKSIKGLGIEISEKDVASCMSKGVFCAQGDIDEGLSHYKDNSFDYLIINQTIQNTKKPDEVLKEVMRISKKAIVSFPNFAFYKIRLQLLLRGNMPKTPSLPFDWYESPNIHMVTIKDFKNYCLLNNFPIEEELHFNEKREKSILHKFMPNAFAMYGFFILNGEKYTQEQTIHKNHIL